MSSIVKSTVEKIRHIENTDNYPTYESFWTAIYDTLCGCLTVCTIKVLAWVGFVWAQSPIRRDFQATLLQKSANIMNYHLETCIIKALTTLAKTSCISLYLVLTSIWLWTICRLSALEATLVSHHQTLDMWHRDQHIHLCISRRIAA